MRTALSRAGIVLAAILCSASYLGAQEQPNPLSSVKSFMYQLEGLTSPEAVKELAQSNYDLLIVDPVFLSKDSSNFDVKGMVQALHQGRSSNKPPRIVLASLNIAEAETDRVYWEPNWHGPGDGQKAFPVYLLAKDPDDPLGSYLCLFWRPRWRELLAGERGLVGKIMDAGFDGLCLDGIDVCENDAISKAADREEINPEEAMVNLISKIRARARQVNPGALILTQNTPELLQGQPKYATVIDGTCAEEIWFSGRPDAEWEDPAAGDVPNRDHDEDSTAGLVRQYQRFKLAGLPVFTIDYCVTSQNAASVYRDSTAAGFIALVTRSTLSKITTTPPPGKQ